MCITPLRRLILAGIVAMSGIALAMPAAAQLLFHGISLQGVCSIAKAGDEPVCTFRIANVADDFLDDIEVHEAWAHYDAITIANPGGDQVRDPAAGNLPIVDVDGTPDCAPGPSLPCTLSPGEAIIVRSDGYTVQPDDPDPLPIRGFAVVRDVCNGTPDPSCNPNALDQANISLAVDLFQPEISISKDASASIAKVGDTISYTITLNNGSSDSTPAISCTVIDSLLGDISAEFPSPLPLGDSVFVVDRDIQGGDPNPVVNSVTANCSIAGFSNTVSDSDDASVALFEPAIAIDKAADRGVAKVGDTVNYTITLSNNSTANTPALNCTLNDSLLGNIVIPSPLPLGDTVVQVARDVQGGDPDPLVNTATLNCSVAGFSNTLTAGDGASVDLLAPSVEVSKQCAPPVLIAGETITWTVVVDNTGDASLDCTLSDATAGLNESVTLGGGASATFEASRATTLEDVPLLSNTASVSCTVSGGVLPNVLTGEATADCEIAEPDIPFGDGICRTPGFWGTHGGTEKRNSSNLTQIVIDAAGGSLSICGEPITNTNVGNVTSALEAICVSIKGEQRLQLARQLTALALNCVVSGGTADCGDTDVADLFADANAACTANSGNLSGWIDQVDCLNNGGRWDAGLAACVFDIEDNCHDRELSESEVFDGVSPLPGPAGSSNACSAATNNTVNIFQ